MYACVHTNVCVRVDVCDGCMLTFLVLLTCVQSLLVLTYSACAQEVCSVTALCLCPGGGEEGCDRLHPGGVPQLKVPSRGPPSADTAVWAIARPRVRPVYQQLRVHTDHGQKTAHSCLV